MNGHMRGSQPWGSQSAWKTDLGITPAARQMISYACTHEHTFEVPFAAEPDVVVPDSWRCPQHGVDSPRGEPVPTAAASGGEAKAPRTHWVMLRERRSIAELEALLAEALRNVRARRRGISGREDPR